MNTIFNLVGANPFSVIGSARNRTEININQSTVSAHRDVTMDASSTGGMISIALGGGFGGDAGIGIAGAYNSISGGIGVFGYNAGITSTSGRVLLHSQINNAMYSVVLGGGFGAQGAGVAANVSGNVLTATNRVDFSSSTINAASDIVLKATNTGEIVGSSMVFAGGKYAGVASPWTANILKGKTMVGLGNTDLFSSAGSIVVDAETQNNMYGVSAAMALSYITNLDSLVTASIGASVTVNDLMNTSEIDIVNSILHADRSILIHTNVDGHLVAVTGNATLAVSLGAAVAASSTYNGIHGTSSINIMDSEMDALANAGANFNDLASMYAVKGLSEKFHNRKGVAVGASSYADLENYFFVVSVSGGAGVNVGVPVNQITGETNVNISRAKINTKGQGGANNAQDVVIEAFSETESRGIVASLAGSAVAIGAMVDIHLLDSITETNILDSLINAQKDILIGARNTDDTDIYLIGVALGLQYAVPINAGGVIQTSKVRTTLDGKTTGDPNVSNTLIHAGKNLDVYAENTLDIFEVNASLAISGVVGAGIAFAVNNLEQNTAIVVKGTTSLISGEVLSVHAKGETIFEEQIDALGAGMTGIGGAMGIVYAKGLTEVIFDGNLTKLNGNSVAVTADDIFTQKTSNVGGFAIGVVGAAGGLNVEVLRNSAIIRGYTNINATKDLIVGATVTRDIDTIAIAGSLGLKAGLAGAVNVIDIGAAKGTRDGLTETSQYLSDIQLTDDPDTQAISKRNTGVFGQFKDEKIEDKVNVTVADNQSAALMLGGTLTAPTITLFADADNTLKTNTTGIGISGIVAAGGAVGVMTVEDDITAAFAGNATATNMFVLEGKSTNRVDSQVTAGAGSLTFAAAGAVSEWNFTSNIETILGMDSVIRGSNVNILANQNFKDTIIKADAGSVSLVGGLGGVLNYVTLGGNAEVHILDNAKVYSPNISLIAQKNYDNVKADTLGFAGSLLASSSGMISKLILEGDAKVHISGNNIRLWSVESGNPNAEIDQLIVKAVINVSDTENAGEVGTGSLAAVAFGNTELEMNFNTLVNLKGVDFRGGKISLKAYQELEASALHTTISAGGAGVAGGISQIDWIGSNTIRIHDSQFDAWKEIEAVAGMGTSTLDAQARIFNYTLIPITVHALTSAKTNVALSDDIFLNNANLKSVEDTILRTAQENKNLLAYAKLLNTYNSSAGTDFISDNEFSVVDSSGTVTSATYSHIDFNKTRIEAGSHYDSYVIIENDGDGVTIAHPEWISVNATTHEVSIYDLYQQQIQSLKEKRKLAELLNNQYDVNAYAVEIQQLEQLLSYYLISGSDPTVSNNYPTARFVYINDNIRAASGDIFIDTGRVTTSGGDNVLTAHGDPRIEIINNSNHFLKLGPVVLDIPNPLDGGGRIMVNGNILAQDAGNANALGFSQEKFELNSLGNDGAQTPFIKIHNTYFGDGGPHLSTELTFDGTQLNNPRGLVDLNSVGNIMMMNGANINARDITITTSGSFFLGYQDGLFNTGGNPLASGTNISAAILEWINDRMYLGKNSLPDHEVFDEEIAKCMKEYKNLTKVEYEQTDANHRLNTAEDAVHWAELVYDTALLKLKLGSTTESWGEAYNEDLHTVDLKKLSQADGITDLKDRIKEFENAMDDLDDSKAAYAKIDEAVSNVLYFVKLKDDLQNNVFNKDTVMIALSSYNDAVTNLQNAVTAESWSEVFGENGSQDIAGLIAKNQGADLVPLTSSFVSQKTEYETILTTAANAWISAKIRTYQDARVKDSNGKNNLGHLF